MSSPQISPDKKLIASFRLGPLLFSEFVVHCHKRTRTSAGRGEGGAEPQASSKQKMKQKQGYEPLATLALAGFEKCVSGVIANEVFTSR